MVEPDELTALVDPWSWPVRFFKRRVLGEAEPTTDMYCVPGDVLHSDVLPGPTRGHLGA